MLDLISRGEAAAQQRAAELHNVMLEEGKNTLQLVNDTLRLAKSASEGTVKAAFNRVTTRANDLEQDAATFLRPYANRDNRDFVNDINQRDRLRKLIDKLKDLEQVNNTLEAPIKFGPNTAFLKALEYYIEKHFDETIETLQILADRTDVPMDLKIRAQYWIAYEQNNIGEFAKAELSFESAISTAEQTRAPIERILELKRLHIELMLFNTKTYKAADLIDNINELIRQTGTVDDPTVKSLLALTKCNVLYAAAMDAHAGGKGNIAQAVAYMREAKKLMEPLASLDRPEQGKEFAQRDWGLISVLLREDEERAKALLYKEVRNWARNQVANRMGTHHKAAFTALQLICLAATDPKDPRIAPLDIQITRLIGEVHDRVRILLGATKAECEPRRFPRRDPHRGQPRTAVYRVEAGWRLPVQGNREMTGRCNTKSG